MPDIMDMRDESLRDRDIDMEREDKDRSEESEFREFSSKERSPEPSKDDKDKALDGDKMDDRKDPSTRDMDLKEIGREIDEKIDRIDFRDNPLEELTLDYRFDIKISLEYHTDADLNDKTPSYSVEAVDRALPEDRITPFNQLALTRDIDEARDAAKAFAEQANRMSAVNLDRDYDADRDSFDRLVEKEGIGNGWLKEQMQYQIDYERSMSNVKGEHGGVVEASMDGRTVDIDDRNGNIERFTLSVERIEHGDPERASVDYEIVARGYNQDGVLLMDALMDVRGSEQEIMDLYNDSYRDY